MKRIFVAVFSIVLLAGFESGERIFAPGIDPWPRWEVHDPASEARIDHGAWQDFLETYVTVVDGGADLLAYDAVTPQDRAALRAYLKTLSEVPISTFNRDEQMAYWLNLYNALTVETVLEAMPVESIRDIDISPGLFASGPWDAELIEVEGVALTLNDVEHRILRPIWRDPRIHYGVNCASIGCPDLSTQAYTGATLEAQLDADARLFVNDPRGVTIDGDRIIVSKIYDWFIEDFDHNEAGILGHLKLYADPELRARIEAIGAIHAVEYDWALNIAPRTGS
jgi:hypothetical protein